MSVFLFSFLLFSGVGGSKGILLEGANIPTLPILSPFVSAEQPSNEIQKDKV